MMQQQDPSAIPPTVRQPVAHPVPFAPPEPRYPVVDDRPMVAAAGIPDEGLPVDVAAPFRGLAEHLEPGRRLRRYLHEYTTAQLLAELASRGAVQTHSAQQ